MKAKYLICSSFILLQVICINACSSQKAESELAAALPLMVINEADFQRDYLKKCASSSQCQAPLVCKKKTCVIPPSLLGKQTQDAPVLKFSTSEGEKQIYIEIASDDYSTQRGMMMRRACHQDWGMLFVFPNESRHAFWMHNTYIPLDMVFIRADGTVSNIHENAEALNDVPRYPSTDKIKYVLELPAGSVKTHQITTSSKFEVSGYQVTQTEFNTKAVFSL